MQIGTTNLGLARLYAVGNIITDSRADSKVACASMLLWRELRPRSPMAIATFDYWFKDKINESLSVLVYQRLFSFVLSPVLTWVSKFTDRVLADLRNGQRLAGIQFLKSQSAVSPHTGLSTTQMLTRYTSLTAPAFSKDSATRYLELSV